MTAGNPRGRPGPGGRWSPGPSRIPNRRPVGRLPHYSGKGRGPRVECALTWGHVIPGYRRAYRGAGCRSFRRAGMTYLINIVHSGWDLFYHLSTRDVGAGSATGCA